MEAAHENIKTLYLQITNARYTGIGTALKTNKYIKYIHIHIETTEIQVTNKCHKSSVSPNNTGKQAI